MVRLITQAMSGEIMKRSLYLRSPGADRNHPEHLRNAPSKKADRFYRKASSSDPVEDGEEKEYLDTKLCFLISNLQDKTIRLYHVSGSGREAYCCGDEPFKECEESYAETANGCFMKLSAFIPRQISSTPTKKHHSTVKDACELAGRLGVSNLILYHTEDKNIESERSSIPRRVSATFPKSVCSEDLESFEL